MSTKYPWSHWTTGKVLFGVLGGKCECLELETKFPRSASLMSPRLVPIDGLVVLWVFNRSNLHSIGSTRSLWVRPETGKARRNEIWLGVSGFQPTRK